MKWFNKKDSGKKESNEGNAIMTMIFLKVKKHSHRENELKVAGKSRAYSSQSFVFFSLTEVTPLFSVIQRDIFTPRNFYAEAALTHRHAYINSVVKTGLLIKK